MSECRQQAWIDAPVAVVWQLIHDVNRHPEWWPRVVDVQCEGLEEGCTFFRRWIEQSLAAMQTVAKDQARAAATG